MPSWTRMQERGCMSFVLGGISSRTFELVLPEELAQGEEEREGREKENPKVKH